MKKVSIFFFALLATYNISSAQLRGTLPEFYGCKWGCSKNVVKSIMVKRGLTLNRDRSNANTLVYNAKTFGGFDTNYIGFSFYKDSLFKGFSVFMADLEPKTLDLYRSIKDDISRKYHSPDIEKEDVKYPYKKGDPDELIALKGGYATISATWFFNGKRCILLNVNSNMVISLQYFDLNIAERVEAIGEKENMNDF